MHVPLPQHTFSDTGPGGSLHVPLLLQAFLGSGGSKPLPAQHPPLDRDFGGASSMDLLVILKGSILTNSARGGVRGVVPSWEWVGVKVKCGESLGQLWRRDETDDVMRAGQLA